jgi:hypothetical protein
MVRLHLLAKAGNAQWLGIPLTGPPTAVSGNPVLTNTPARPLQTTQDGSRAGWQSVTFFLLRK